MQLRLLLRRLAGALLTVTWALPAGAASPIIYVDQGPSWTAASRSDFYSRDQGSQVMPLAWIVALQQPNGQPFMADSLGRYGYLENPQSVPAGLPVGFTVAPGAEGQTLGMTCAACHTRQIDVEGQAYRIDGGPAIVDFQSFLADLDSAVGSVLGSDAAFARFAAAVLGPSPSPGAAAALRSALQAWYLPYHTLMAAALPQPPWGPARLDAVSMIFNRVAGLDIGPPPTYMIPANIQPAFAPVRYPFLWNAPRQDYTQWPGFAANGNSLLGLSRNLGEVYGVFAVFHPRKDEWRVLGIDYLSQNSANFAGLLALEERVREIGPPRWPWAVDRTLALQGETIYSRSTAGGGCADCHGVRPGKTRPIDQKTWATPIQDVGTDSREYEVLARTVQTGVLQGAHIPFLSKPLQAVDKAINVLSLAVGGSILQHYSPLAERTASAAKAPTARSATNAALQDNYRKPEASPTGAAYESRVLQGIWAAAPYLHNGSVPTLAELLKPAAERSSSFAVGPAYDTVNVGLAARQTRFDYRLQTTDCSQRASGNSRCGHEFGTQLSAQEKKALIEYLKTL